MKNKKNPVKEEGKKKKKGRTNAQDSGEKEEKRKEKKREQTKERWRRKGKKGSKGAADLTSGSLHVCLITKIPLKTEFWKLKTPKMCF